MLLGGLSDDGQMFKSLTQNKGRVQPSSDPGLRRGPVGSHAQQGKA